MAPLIRQKMPHKLNLMLSRKLADSRKGDDFIDITAISDFLEAELSARESVEMTSMTSSLSLSGSSSDKPSGSGKSQGHKSDYKVKVKAREGNCSCLGKYKSSHMWFLPRGSLVRSLPESQRAEAEEGSLCREQALLHLLKAWSF